MAGGRSAGARGQAGASDEESTSGAQVGTHVEPPSTRMVAGLETEEGSCVHDARMIRSDPAGLPS